MRRSPQENTALTSPVLGPARRARRKLLWDVEVRILAFGLFLTARFAAMTGLNLTVGRAAGMSFGYASGLQPSSVITSSVLVETIQVLVIYPLFVLSWKSLVDARRMLRKTWVARYGMVGLFAFVFLPFWMTGPVVGSVIGFLIGLKARHNLPVVLSATYVAVVIWAVFFDRMNDWLAAYGRYSAFGLVLVVAVAALATRIVWAWRQRGRAPACGVTEPPRSTSMSDSTVQT